MAEKVLFKYGNDVLYSDNFDILPSPSALDIIAQMVAKSYNLPYKHIVIRIEKVKDDEQQ